METVPYLLYAAAGGLAGLTAGLFGLGGGVVLVPALLYLFAWQGFPPPYIPVAAVATSLATIMVTAIVSIGAHHRLGSLDWRAASRLFPGIVIGSLFGAWLADQLPGDWLKTVFAVYLLGVAMQMLWRWRPAPAVTQPQPWLLTGVGGAIGTLSAMLGIGGGTLTVPFLVKCAYPMRVAVAVSSACGFPIALAGTIAYGILGWEVADLPSGSAGYVYLPAFFGIIAASMLTAPLGARLAHRLPAETLRQLFAGVLILIGGKVLYGG
ncbi:sulfite exporter TauE/SafE family protein [Methylohalobius crimeensis]|uniref:sulfite exporter TauE/SafE family protein n=1 Tax=Methylohalobius crimeensis TaxID=244365 RepID=UPI0003B787E9|nr:sulfite exporter TauE/SafE family protein [Methylohalobius crimeensis]